MKKIYWILGLIVLFFVGDRVGGVLLEKLLQKSQFRYTRLYQGKASADILLVGNSRGLIFYQPYIEELTGKSTFNLSYNGMPMDLGYALVADYFEKNESPEIMILDITMGDRINNQLLAGFNLYEPYSTHLSQLLKEESPKSYYAGQLTHLYRYNSEVFQRALAYINKDDEDWLIDRVISDAMVNKIDEEEDYRIAADSVKYIDALDEIILPALQNTLNLAKAKNVKVKLVVNPYYPPFADKIVNLNDFINKVETATNMKVHNYAKSVTDKKGFGDYQHLNKFGSKLFIDLMRRDGIF